MVRDFSISKMDSLLALQTQLLCIRNDCLDKGLTKTEI